MLNGAIIRSSLMDATGDGGKIDQARVPWFLERDGHQLIDPMPDDAVTGKVGAGTARADSRPNRRAAL